MSLEPVLFLANVYPPENLIGALRPARFARYLPEFGYQAHVITASPQPEPSPVRYVPYQPGRLEKYLSLALFPHDDRMSWTWTAAAAGAEALRRVPARIVFSTFPPLSGHLAAWRLKRRFGLRWVADFRDPLIGNFGRRAARSLWVDGLLEKLFFGEADILIANTEAAGRFWARRYPQYAGKIRVIYNGFDPRTPQLEALPIPARPFRRLLHAGSLYSSAYPGELMARFAAWIRQGLLDPSAVRLRMIGDIQDEAVFLGLEAVRELTASGFLDCTPRHLPVAEARRIMAESDWFLVLDRFSSGGTLQLAAKVFEYIQVGRPVLAFTAPGSPVERVLEISAIPHVCLYRGEPAGAQQEKAARFFQMPPDAVRPSGEYVQRFGAEGQTRQLAAIFRELTE
jgi:glycosyltransferase involved in cell wall biosynthesis